RAWTAKRTQTAYSSYRRGISAWIQQNKEDSGRDFEDFLLSKMNASEHVLKVATLSGYRSAIKDIYIQKKSALPSAYEDGMKSIFAGLKQIEAMRNQLGAGEAKMAGLEDGGFARLFFTLPWNLMCRPQSVESIYSGHSSNQDDSIGIIFHKCKTNQDGSGPKDPTHLHEPIQTVGVLHYLTCCVLGLFSTPRSWASISWIVTAKCLLEH
ncbi:hypothetical protein PHMEG_00038468, partial [Phytophthora megakarya]